MEGKVRLQFGLGQNPEVAVFEEVMDAILIDIKAVEMVGTAPKGPLERQITTMLEKRKRVRPQLERSK